MDAQHREQLQRVTDTTGHVVLLELNADTFGAPLRLANDTSNHTLDGNEYIALPFGFKLPDHRQGGSARAQLIIDNVGRGITEELEALPPGEVLMAKIMVCPKTDPLEVMYYTYLPITNVSTDMTKAAADCGIDFLLRQKTMKLRFTPYLTPGVH